MGRYSELDEDEIVALSRIDIENGKLDEALLKLRPLINCEQPPPEAISMMARLYAQIKLFERAENLFRRYVEQNSDALIELFLLGMSLFDGGKHDEAVMVWDSVLASQPKHPPAMYYKSLVLVSKGEIDVASSTLNEILRNVAADNLYFSRARDLLKDIESAQVKRSTAQEISSLLNKDENAYKNIQ